MSENKNTKVRNLTGKEVEKELAPKIEPQVITLPVEEVNMFNQVLGLILVGDDRLKPIQTHFIEMIKRNNEINTERPTK